MFLYSILRFMRKITYVTVADPENHFWGEGGTPEIFETDDLIFSSHT